MNKHPCELFKPPSSFSFQFKLILGRVLISKKAATSGLFRLIKVILRVVFEKRERKRNLQRGRNLRLRSVNFVTKGGPYEFVNSKYMKTFIEKNMWSYAIDIKDCNSSAPPRSWVDSNFIY